VEVQTVPSSPRLYFHFGHRLPAGNHTMAGNFQSLVDPGDQTSSRWQHVHRSDVSIGYCQGLAMQDEKFKLSRMESIFSLQQVLLRKLMYPLPATTFTQEQCQTIMSPILAQGIYKTKNRSKSWSQFAVVRFRLTQSNSM